MNASTGHADRFGTEWLSRALEGCPDSVLRATSCEIRGPLFVRQNSRIFFAKHPGLPGPAAIKLCLLPFTDTPDGPTARLEFEGLQRVHAAMTNADYSVPRPYFLCEAQGLLAMEWIAGKDMTTLLFSGCAFPEAEKLMQLAAGWLRCFHRAGRLAPARLDAGARLDQADVRLGQSPLARDPVFSNALWRMRETAKDAGAAEFERGWIHGDFKTDNLILADKRTVGLDIHSRIENVVLYDVGPFLNHLDLKLLHPRAWRLWRQRARLGKAFLAAYGFETSESAMLSLNWLRLYFMLAGWDSLARKRMGAVPSLMLHRLYRHATRRVIDDMVRS